MLMEIGFALANNKRLILAIKPEVTKIYLREIADSCFEWKDLNDLRNKLENYTL